MKLCFPLNHSHVTVISTYAPTLVGSEETKEKFYEDLDKLVVKEAPTEDKLILLGDFNTRGRTDHSNWKGVLGPHLTGKMNANGQLLLTLCAENTLTITITFFRQADKYKTTWMHPRRKQWHVLDYAICRRRDISDFKITRAMRGAEC